MAKVFQSLIAMFMLGIGVCHYFGGNKIEGLNWVQLSGIFLIVSMLEKKDKGI